MVEYYVVLGDVVHSREIEDREAFQDRLAETCAQFRAAERDDVYGDFKILKGVDEFGGVLQSLANLYDVVRTFQDELRPHEVRIVVASGSIDVGLTSFDVEKMDGEAFHRASRRLAEIEDGPLAFDLLVEDDGTSRAVADEINLLSWRRREWTDRQREVIEVRRAVDTQAAAAGRLGVTQQAVSNVLAGANWPLVETVERRLAETLREYDESQAAAVATADRIDEAQVTGTAAVDDPEGHLRRELGTRADEATSLTTLGLIAHSRAEYDEAEQYLRRAVDLDPGDSDRRRYLARVLAEQGAVDEALLEYERVLDRGPGNETAYFEFAELAIERSRHDEALTRLFRLLDAAIDDGRGAELIETVRVYLDDVVEPILANATDRERAEAMLEYLARIAERAAGASGEDVRLWASAGFARWPDVAHERAYPNADVPGARTVDGYSKGLGFLLAGEPEAAVPYFRRAWTERDELAGRERGYAVAAGVGLLGCAELLGPSVLDDDPATIRRELADEDDALRAPANQFLERLDDGSGGLPVTVHDDDHEQFSRLEAEAFDALRAEIRRREGAGG